MKNEYQNEGTNILESYFKEQYSSVIRKPEQVTEKIRQNVGSEAFSEILKKETLKLSIAMNSRRAPVRMALPTKLCKRET